MNCPRCRTPLQARPMSVSDALRSTHYLFPSCLYRTVRKEPNPVIPLELKTPMPAVATKKRNPVDTRYLLSPISTAFD